MGGSTIFALIQNICATIGQVVAKQDEGIWLAFNEVYDHY